MKADRRARNRSYPRSYARPGIRSFQALVVGAGLVVAGAALGLDAPYANRGEAGAALNQATRALADAQARAAKLDQEAASASQAADRTARETAAIAARIQQTEAEIALAHARIAVIDRDRADLRASIAQREQPLVRLTAALQMMSRRPLAFSLMRADSLRETVWLRATLETMLPEVAGRTAALRAEIARGRQLQDQARTLAAGLEASQRDLGTRQKDLVAIESRQRIASRAATGDAGREADRALALAEQTRDLGSLVTQLERDDTLGRRLAALPGPLPRPANINAAGTLPGHMLMVEQQANNGPPLLRFTGILPVAGRLLSGFGEAGATGPAHGVTLAPAGGAQAVAPAAGRIAFAGPYNGYAHIVIIAHDDGWSSLITGLGRIDVAVGETVVQGAPLGVAEPGHPRVMVELRKDGSPVNPMEFLHP